MVEIKRDKAIQLMVTDEEYEKIKNLAASLGVSIPFFVRAAALQTTELVISPKDKESAPVSA